MFEDPKPDSVRTLKARYSRTVGRMSALVDAAGGRKMTPAERDEFSQLERESREIASTIGIRKRAKELRVVSRRVV
jgi:hypothetical protein